MTPVAASATREAYRDTMFDWSSPLTGSAADRQRLVTRALAEQVMSVVVMAAAIGASMVALLPVAIGLAIGLVALWLAQPVIGWTILPRRRCQVADAVRRAVSRAAAAGKAYGELPAGTVATCDGEIRVALLRATESVECFGAALTARLHHVPHHCALRSRLTAAIAAGC